MEAEVKKCVSRNFIEFCQLRYPQMTGLAERRFFLYVCFSNWNDRETGQTLIPYQLIAKCCGIDSDKIADGNFNTGQFLHKFKKTILPQFSWVEYESTGWNMRCRRIANKGLDQPTLAMIKMELEHPPTEKYYFDSGRKFNEVKLSKDRKTVLQEYQELYQQFKPTLNDTQLKMLSVLIKTGMSNSFAKKQVKNAELIEDTIRGLQLDHDDIAQGKTIEDKQLRQRSILESIKEESRVFYKPSAIGNTPRLHHHGDCVLSLCREVRKAFCHGWTDVDLVSSQFVILANLLQATQAQKLIKDGVHLWTYLNSIAFGKWEKPAANDKKVFKQLIYGLCFGMTLPNVYNSLQLLGSQVADNLINNSMIQELFGQREKWFDRIKQERCLTDVWGKTHRLTSDGFRKDIYGNLVPTEGRWFGSLAATKIQSIEMEIISAIHQLILDKPQTQCYIMLHQHDGLCVSFYRPSDKQNIQHQMQQAITQKATEVGDKLGIDLTDMKLEFEDL
jgi:hypothetical protein